MLLIDTGGRRRLAAILAADAAGYSRLMAADEEATVATLDAARSVFRAQIEGNQGRIIDMAGDSVLAMFETATGAVTASLAIQGDIESGSKAIPEDRRMRFRIGVHLGDVIEKSDGTIYGDGVNIAARLQTLAEPGGVTVSSIVQEAVRDRVAAGFQDQGLHAVKNIARPVHVFRVVGGAAGTLRRYRRPRSWRVVVPSAVSLAIAIGAWVAMADSAKDVRSRLASLVGKNSSQTSPDRATIAVMPFANQSGDPARDYFSVGITEDVISALGRFSGVMVMSRNAVQSYKGRAAAPAEISRELGVRYLVQGSVREAGGRLRVAVELSDAEKGAQLWSERYEGEGVAVFEIQDRIVRDIVGALAVRLTRIELQRVVSKPIDSLETYDLVLRARSLLDRVDRSANREARALLVRADKMSPENEEVLIAQAEAELHRALYGWVEDVDEAMRRAEALCRRVLASGDARTHVRAHGVMATIYSNQGRFEDALSHAERASELNPSDSAALFKRGMALLYIGRTGDAITVYEMAKRFEPQPNPNEAFSAPFAYYVAGRYREALAHADAMLARVPDHVGLHTIRAATLAQLGNDEEARRTADQVRRLSPYFQAENVGTRFRNPDDAAKVQDGLRKAGL